MLVYLGFGLTWALCKGVPDRSPRPLRPLYSLVRYCTNVVAWPLCGLTYMLQEARQHKAS